MGNRFIFQIPDITFIRLKRLGRDLDHMNTDVHALFRTNNILDLPSDHFLKIRSQVRDIGV